MLTVYTTWQVPIILSRYSPVLFCCISMHRQYVGASVSAVPQTINLADSIAPSWANFHAKFRCVHNPRYFQKLNLDVWTKRRTVALYRLWACIYRLPYGTGPQKRRFSIHSSSKFGTDLCFAGRGARLCYVRNWRPYFRLTSSYFFRVLWLPI